MAVEGAAIQRRAQIVRGGHSLMAMRLIMGVQDMLGVDVSLRDLSEGQTIEQMLAVIFAQSEEDVLDPV